MLEQSQEYASIPTDLLQFETVESRLGQPMMVQPLMAEWARPEVVPFDRFSPLDNLVLSRERITGGITEGRTAPTLNNLPRALADTSEVRLDLRYLGQPAPPKPTLLEAGTVMIEHSPTYPTLQEASTDLQEAWQPRQTWVVIHGWNSDPESVESIADSVNRARDGQDAVVMLDWGEAAKNGGVFNGGNYRAASWISSVADWAADELRDWGISDTYAQTHLNLVGYSLGALLSSELASRFDGGVNTIFAIDPASEFNTVSDSGYDYDNDGQTERPVRFDAVSRHSRAFVGSRSVAGNREVAGWAHESVEMDFGFNLFGNEHAWVPETFANFIDDDDAIANQLGVKNLDPISSNWKKDAYDNRHEARMVVDRGSQLPNYLEAQSNQPGQDDILYGTERDDRLSGDGGRDWLYGDAGNDRLTVGSGQDILIGGRGRDVLSGGRDRDRFDFAAGDGAATVSEADVITDFFAGNSTAPTETIGLGAGLSKAQIQLEAGFGAYAGDVIVRHDREVLFRFEDTRVGEIAIGEVFVSV